jgi:hypothetical protein
MCSTTAHRLALKHPERVTALAVQNGNAYEDGLKEFWNPFKAYWADGSKQHREALRVGLTPEATRTQYMKGVRDASRISPEPGCMIKHCSTGLVSMRSCLTCSRTTTVPTLHCTRNSSGCFARAGRRLSSRGDRMMRYSQPLARMLPFHGEELILRQMENRDQNRA